MKLRHSLTALVVAGLSANAAHAASYAVSIDSITGFSLGFVGGTASFGGFTFSNSAAADDMTLEGGILQMDAPAACVDCAYNNSFTSHGTGGDYAYGDALIQNVDVLSGNGSASAIGEASAMDGFGFGLGNNTMLAAFQVTSAASVAYSFTANPFMQTQASAGGQASAEMDMVIGIFNSSNQLVFGWTPDGLLGAGIFGGAEIADPFSLNHSTGGNSIFDPGSGYFSAASLALLPGTYTMYINMTNTAAAVSPVPVPAALPLLLSGIAGLFGFARRRRP